MITVASSTNQINASVATGVIISKPI